MYISSISNFERKWIKVMILEFCFDLNETVFKDLIIFDSLSPFRCSEES